MFMNLGSLKKSIFKRTHDSACFLPILYHISPTFPYIHNQKGLHPASHVELFKSCLECSAFHLTLFLAATERHLISAVAAHPDAE